ncbi:glycosyltransferase family 39 protein, partial [Methanobrevibacter sp. OttesenSCG-928-K11]|nr:glycosyltransferase family 39 protein [Methanobrevibacter sp. OttesenSCG-928-K11]
NKNKLSLIFIILFAFIITFTIIWINSTESFLGHSYRDVYLYLIDALKFSGLEIGGYDYVDYLSPLIPFLTSLLFKLGFVSETSIFITTGIFFFFAIIGIYLILKLKFNNTIAIFGTILYTSLAMNLQWAGNGTIDIPSISLAIWGLYLFILGVEKNQKFFYLAFPIAVLSFFAKYTGIFVFGLMGLYFLSKPHILNNIKKYFKNLLGGVIFGILTATPFITHFLVNDIPFGFLNQAGEVASKTSTTATSGGKLIGNDLLFYFEGLIYYISGTEYIYGIIILIFASLGLILTIYKFQDTIKNSFKKIKSINILKYQVPPKLFYLLIIISIILIAFSFLTASLFSVIYSEMILFIAMFLFSYSVSKIILKSENITDINKSSYPNLALNITMFAFFFAYIVFFSSHLTKADRYFTAMAPGFIYLVSFCINEINLKLDLKNKLNLIIPIALIIILLISAGSFLSRDKYDSIYDDERNAANWIENTSPDYKNLVIWADRGPIYTWLFEKEVFYVKDAYTVDELNDALVDANATYYIHLGGRLNLTDYVEVNKYDDTIIYKKI